MSGRGRGNDATVDADQCHRQIEAADQRTDAAADGRHLAHAGMTCGVERLGKNGPLLAQFGQFMQHLLVHRGADAQHAFVFNADFQQFRDAVDDHQPF